jgi:hypothetical protein
LGRVGANAIVKDHLLDVPICALHEILLQLDWELYVLVLAQVHRDELQL